MKHLKIISLKKGQTQINTEDRNEFWKDTMELQFDSESAIVS